MSVEASFHVVAGKYFDEITAGIVEDAERFDLDVIYTDSMSSSAGIIGFELFSATAWELVDENPKPTVIELSVDKGKILKKAIGEYKLYSFMDYG